MSGKNILSLKQFMRRSEVLKLYRDIHRCIRRIPDPNHRAEMATWARHDFKRHSTLTDEVSSRLVLRLYMLKTHHLNLESHTPGGDPNDGNERSDVIAGAGAGDGERPVIVSIQSPSHKLNRRNNLP